MSICLVKVKCHSVDMYIDKEQQRLVVSSEANHTLYSVKIPKMDRLALLIQLDLTCSL